MNAIPSASDLLETSPKPASRTIPTLLAEISARYPDRPALVSGDLRWNYSELRYYVKGYAKGLTALGVARGSRVAVLMGNRPEWIVAALAICSLGAIMVAVNTWLTVRELRYVLEHSDTDTLIFTPRFLRSDFAAMLNEITANPAALPKLKQTIHVGQAGCGESIAFNTLPWLGRKISDAEIGETFCQVQANDVAYLLYTSGSTAAPKGVQIHHEGLIANVWAIGERMHVTTADRLWLAISLFWGFGCENALFNALTHGACLVLQEHFDAAEALRLIEQERCTLLYATPNIVKALHAHPDRAQRNLSSLRSGGTFGTSDQMKLAIELGAHEICHIYGLTEVYGNCHVTDCRHDPVDKRLTSVGRPLPGFTQRIVDPETLKPRSVGEVGEILLKGHVTSGYYKDPQRTQLAFTADGFFRTGDLGFVDEEGFLYFRGRLKEMIKSGGINVSPAEIEDILSSHPAIEAAYVVGIPDAEKDEVIGAVIIGKKVDADELKAFCRERLATYKIPHKFCFVSERDLPLTTTGKLQRARLAELFQL
ncbi:class I adenylate-forming enzyme family protein [Afipia sp. P52-10]|uniref:class I adenylate-forming enzyme family protein n=1 Tax=Afipia sp. P52-10 TaxID=1429916 RepID=UPI0006849A0F|nr:AMP-binding protein [Afipia sp. P52-10]